ncbi:MAG TPA: sugar nucleotide-binding protein [Caldimonas sp.]|nr:sugar nucleotide-binding protein [Caldimonas sp.]
MSKNEGPAALEMWGGVECTVNRVRDAYHTQLDRNGHLDRDGDLERFAALGLRALRYPVLWETTAPDGPASADWSWADRRLPALRRLGVAPIVGLVHHGSGPRHTSLLCPRFAEGLAEFAAAVAARYPWVDQWTPVNEPLTTARFSALYGLWYPHACDDRSFVAALVNQCRATVLAMQAIRRVNPAARLVQTDDISRTYGTEPLRGVVEFYNERRWLAWDLLCGRVDCCHPLWSYLRQSGADASELLWFADHPCPPDLIGANYYVTSERWLDHRVERYPDRAVGGVPGERFVDIESVRVLATPAPAIASLLEEAWQRYRIPLAVTEAHIDAGREDQLRWLLEIWRAAQEARSAGVEVRAVTAWSLLGSFDWNCLLGECRGYYEPGPFDIRSPEPRPTALAALIGELATGREASHPVLQGEGWWRRADRFVAKPIVPRSAVTPLAGFRPHAPGAAVAPILVSGAGGTLGRAFAAICGQRNIAFRVLDRAAMDIADRASVAAAIARWKPWAIVNASGYVRIDAAEADVERCFRENAVGPAVLAEACAEAGIRLVTFSSDQVFDGRGDRARVESDTTAPLNVYGASKAAGERDVLARCAQALVVRTSAFFGPWDRHNFVCLALAALERGETFRAATDERISPTYVPDLVHACLDLLIDGEAGIWHLANAGDVSWAELATRAAALAGIATTTLVPCPSSALGLVAARPRHGVLASERGALMPSLDDALQRFLAERVGAAEAATDVAEHAELRSAQRTAGA